MREELVNMIEVLQYKIEQLEAEHIFNINSNAPVNSLKAIRGDIKKLKIELLALQLQLLDELPSKKKLIS
jgi:hypothetical protein